MKKLIAAAAVAGAMAFAPANATIVSFADYADTEGERGVASGTTLTIEGLVMTFFAFDGFSPYFDASGRDGPAGLGVCKVLDARDQCDPGSDDSIDNDGAVQEAVVIQFADDQTVNLDGISFSDFAHDPVNPAALVEYFVVYDGGLSDTLFVTDTFANVVAAFAAGFDDVVKFGFRRPVGADGLDFYVEALDAEFDPIPVPAALPLLLSGLAGLGFASR
ncbi:MAG: hypothetical protein KJN99_04735, partial [Marinicaulis sp.]|nr:hypothetical protein [Marinicaulis sp.]